MKNQIKIELDENFNLTNLEINKDKIQTQQNLSDEVSNDSDKFTCIIILTIMFIVVCLATYSNDDLFLRFFKLLFLK
jgi:hypothetical protein